MPSAFLALAFAVLGPVAQSAKSEEPLPPLCEGRYCSPPVKDVPWPEPGGSGPQVLVGARLSLSLPAPPDRILQGQDGSVYFEDDGHYVAVEVLYPATLGMDQRAAAFNTIVRAVFEGEPKAVEARHREHAGLVRSLFAFKRLQAWHEVRRFRRGGLTVYAGGRSSAPSAIVVNENAGTALLDIEAKGISWARFRSLLGSLSFQG